jgi:hypothetical protein
MNRRANSSGSPSPHAGWMPRAHGGVVSGVGFGVRVAVACAVLLGGVGCARTHLSPNHGRAYREIFAAQAVGPRPGVKPKSVDGLDSQEASIIAGNYRKALSPKDSGDAQKQMIMTPTGPREVTSVPATSVPNGGN